MSAPSREELRREYLLDPEIAFLNHGSFGACPRPVFERYQARQRELESEPVDFLDRRQPALLDAARAALADYVGCHAEDLAFVQNATTGVNLAARSVALGPDDEVLATDLEYGACELAWEWACRRAGARYMRAPIPLPLRHPSEVVDALFAHASERTRAVYVSHRLVCEARHDLCELLGTQPIAPDSMIAQMAAVRLPRPMADLSERLFTRHRIEIPLGRGHDFLRLSVAGYTTRDEIDRLLAALVRELDAEHGQRDE